MKLSNKVLLGGFIFPIIFTIGVIIFLTITSPPEVEFQFKQNNWDLIS